jgi:hypothetical protein
LIDVSDNIIANLLEVPRQPKDSTGNEFFQSQGFPHNKLLFNLNGNGSGSQEKQQAVQP